MLPRILLLAVMMSLALANPTFAQKGKPRSLEDAAKAATQKKVAIAEKKGSKADDKVVEEKEQTPDQMAARERLNALEKDFRMIDSAIEAHERRIRTVMSIRVPPGVRPPQVDPVPAELLQRRAALWNAMQQAIRDGKQ